VIGDDHLTEFGEVPADYIDGGIGQMDTLEIRIIPICELSISGVAHL
jgi:hypothetical protein